MDHLSILNYIAEAGTLTYVVLFTGLLFEGDILLFTSAFLLREGILHPFPFLLTVALGTIIGDALWFYLGSHFPKYLPKLHAFLDKVAEPFDRVLHANPFRTLFTTKFLYGTHRPVLMRTGSSHMSLRTFLQNDIPAVVLWATIICGLGYATSASFSLIRHYLRFAEIALGISVILFILILIIVRHTSRARMSGEAPHNTQ